MMKNRKILAFLLFVTICFSTVTIPLSAKTTGTDIDDGIMAKWVLGPDGYDDGFGMNTAGGSDKAQKMLNGDRFVRYDNHGFWNARTALPVGSYYFKFLVKIKRGSGAVDEGDRPFFVTIPGENERADRSGPVLKAFPDGEWVTVSIPFVIGNNLAYRNIEFAIKGAMPWIIGGSDAECYIGREIVVSTNNKPLVYQGVVASYAMQGGYGDVGAVKGTLNDDRSRTYTGQDSMYEFKATLPQGNYWVKMITKTSGKNSGANLDGEISSFKSSAGLNEKLPALNQYTDGEWKNVMIPLTIDAASAGKQITYSVLGPQNGAKDLTIEEYILICDNDRPLDLPQEIWRDRVIPASHLANGIGLNANNFGGARKTYDPADDYMELKSTLGTDRFAWDIQMNLSRKQFVDSGYISKGKVYVKILAKVPVLASSATQNEKLFSIEMRSGATVVDTANFNYGLFTEADKYQTLVYEFDINEHSSFGGNGEWAVRFDGRFFTGVSDLHIKSITLSATPGVTDDSKVITNGIIWPDDQQLPSFGTPADTLELVDIRDNTDIMYRSAMTSLQGLVNKKQPRIIVAETNEEAEGNGFAYNRDYWPASLGLNYVFAQGSSTNERILNMIKKYGKEIDGFILYSGASNNYNDLNVATTIAGIYNAVPVNQGILDALRAAPYNMDAGTWPVIRDISTQNFGSGTSSTAVRDSRIAAYNYLYDNYSPANAEAMGNKPYNDRIITIINPEGHFAIRDLAVAVASPVVWLDSSNTQQKNVLTKFFTDMKDNHNNGLGAVGMGFWPSEEQGVKHATDYGITSVPSDNFENYTVYSGMSRIIDPPTVPAKPDLVGGINYISLATSDGDNLAYLEHGMRYGQRTGDRTRGYFPINWTMSPALLDAAPQILQYYYNTATNNDAFIIGPDGYGYTRTESWPSTTVKVNGEDASWINGYAELTNRYVEKTGLNYPTLWGDVLRRTNINRLTQDKFNQYADFDYFPALGGAYYLNPIGTFALGNQAIQSTQSAVYGQWFNFSYYAGDGTGQGAIGDENSAASTTYTGTVYGRIKGLSQILPTNENTFNAVQIQNWTGDLVRKINDLQNYSNKNYSKNSFVRSDHYFMLMAEANGDPINNALQANAYASASDAGYEPGKAVDGSFGKTHGWKSSADGEQWLVVDFGKRQDITRYVLKNAELAGYPANYNTKGWKFQVSNDGRSWTTIDEVTDNTDATVYRTATYASARFVRILVTDTGADSAARIQDIEIYGVNNWDKETLTYTTYKEELNQEITNTASLNQKDYTNATWQVIVDKKAAAQAVSENVNATQSEIDTAMLALRDAINGLEEIDTTVLDTALTSASGITQPEGAPNYSSASWTAFKNALSAAQAVKTATEEIPMMVLQSDINTAAANLTNAIKALTTDKSILASSIQNAQNKKEEDYTAASWQNMKNKLAEAVAVNNNASAKQYEIDTANTNLLAAINGLAVDRSQLQATILSVGSLIESDYSKASWSSLQTALQNANSINTSQSATQTQINAANTALKNAISALTTDKTELNATIQSVDSLAESDYEADLWQAMQTVLQTAITVKNNASAKQSEIDTANINLKNAIKNLGMDKEELLVTINKAKALVEADYSKESWSALKTVLQKAEGVYNDPNATPLAIKNVNGELEAAMDALTVDKTSLSSAVLLAAEYAEKDYSSVSWNAFKTALESAKTVEADADAKQSEIDEAEIDLAEAITGLRSVKEEYEEIKAEMDKLDPQDYVKDSWDKALELLGEVKTMLDGNNFNSAEINKLLNDLNEAKGGLLLAVKDIPSSIELKVGESITFNPVPEGGEWEWSEEYLKAAFNSPATFTALKEGATVIKYTTSQGVEHTINVSIKKDSTGDPYTGDGIYYYYVIILLVGAAGVFMADKLKKGKNAE